MFLFMNIQQNSFNMKSEPAEPAEPPEPAEPAALTAKKLNLNQESC